MEDYTLFLNYFNKDKDLLIKQLDRVRSQTHTPALVMACFLGTKNTKLFAEYLGYVKKHKLKNWKYTTSNYDWKYVGRYQLAINAPTDYVVVLDDDRFPCKNYCKNMVKIAKQTNGIINQYGWTINKETDGSYTDMDGTFWTPNLLKKDNKNNIKYKLLENKQNLIEVDYLCGGMVFHKKHLVHLFNSPLITDKTGEDIIFCLSSKKAGVPVYMYMPFIKSDGSDMLEHYGGEVSSTLDPSKKMGIRKVRSLLIQKYKQ